jgi:hypothetical protein
MSLFNKLFGTKTETIAGVEFETPLTPQQPEATDGESQNKRILKYLKSGKTLTGMEALKLFDCFSLPQRINNLRSFGFDIKTTMISTPSKKRVAEYSINQ